MCLNNTVDNFSINALVPKISYGNYEYTGCFLYLIVPKIQDLREPALDVLNEIFMHMETLS